MSELSPAQLTGRDDSHIEFDGSGIGLTAACREALLALGEEAAVAGFNIQVVSGFRSFERQAAIWNAKCRGERGVHDDAGAPVGMAGLEPVQRIHAILRFSALPGSSRHHWGTDLDIYDANAVAGDYQVQLTPGEVANDGVFGPFHQWLDQRIAADESFGFYRPYDVDRGGVAPERWHLSFAPESAANAEQMNLDILKAAVEAAGLELVDELLELLPDIYQRYVLLPTA